MTITASLMAMHSALGIALSSSVGQGVKGGDGFPFVRELSITAAVAERMWRRKRKKHDGLREAARLLSEVPRTDGMALAE